MQVSKLRQPSFMSANGSIPLNDNQMVHVAPAIFNRGSRNPTALSKYTPVATIDVVNALRVHGYEVASIAQERSKSRFRDVFGKHMVRMRPITNFEGKLPAERSYEDVVPELVIVNAHNTSSSLHIIAGLWRFICLNGMMAGTALGGYSFRHDRGVAQQAIESSEKMQAVIPTMMEDVALMQGVFLREKEQSFFAARALALRWGSGTDAVTTDSILWSRREADKGDSLWHVFNRVQENLLNGGILARNRNATIKPLTNVTTVVDINRKLWDLASSIAKPAKVSVAVAA